MAAIRLCSVEGCRNRHLARGFCHGHYERLTKFGSALAGSPVKQKAHTPCSIEGCGLPAYGKGLCVSHYTRLRRHGAPEAGGDSRGHVQEYVAWLASAAHGSSCLTWPFARNQQGYGVATSKPGTQALASRVVCEATYGKPPYPRMQAAHTCGNGHLGCINPRHLAWKTTSANNLDKNAHGTMLVGAMLPQTKLDPGRVREIRSLIDKRSNREIGAQFGVTGSTIWAIETGRTWAWVS